MKFSELESLMESRGVNTLADIARALSTTPQAVSNWKARNQVPHHVVANINNKSEPKNLKTGAYLSVGQTNFFEKETISISDILLTVAEQLKVIVLVIFISIFLTFTYVQFLLKPIYVSYATIILPDSKANNLGGLANIASQFGVNVPSGMQADISSPTLFPELLKSRRFSEKILEKKFFTKEFGKELSLLAILTHGNNLPKFGKDTLITKAVNDLSEMFEFQKDPLTSFSKIEVKASEPIFAKNLAEVVLSELEGLNRFFKSQTVSNKISFIENRIASVNEDLEFSERALKKFKESNRQVTSPSLELEQDRLDREVEVQKSIFLTLKQQLELAKIEEVQESSIVQVLDKPKIPLYPINKNLILSVFISSIVGLCFGVLLAFIRSFLDNSDINERRKLRRVKNYLNKKSKDIFLDKRISGTISFLLFLGLPIYLSHESQNPAFFGLYSAKMLIVNVLYILLLISSLLLYLSLRIKRTSHEN